MSFDRPRTDVLTVVNSQSVAVGATSTQSTPVGLTGQAVRLCPTTSCYVAFGPNPTADANSILLPANTPGVFTIKRGWRVAVLQVSAAGACNVAEVL